MSKAGNDYWRLNVELQALSVEQRAGSEGEAIRGRMAEAWDALPEQDRAEMRERFKAALGE